MILSKSGLRRVVLFLIYDINDAMADLDKAIELNPTNAVAFVSRGVVKNRKGDIQGARADCQKAIELYGTNSMLIAYDQGMIDFISGDFEKAIASWQKVIQNNASLKIELEPWIEKAQAKLAEKQP
ncbi:MAG: hypothetical protein ABSE16_00940 [Verrucomicrobiota bacterium]|jgi:tetratricopeptide (TPR) repeat protein